MTTELVGRASAAMTAAAIGDALGWPQEMRGRNVDRRGVEPALRFRAWRRGSGDRYRPYDEQIGAGEYSDDTQLLLAVARSLECGDQWWDRFTTVELPAWLVYQRGGGRAVLRAARAWAAGTPPWRDTRSNDAYAYFEAGSNGAAMRVLPHAIRGAVVGEFPLENIVRDSVATHGHPRAIVGALVHAYALWAALGRRETLPYGELLDALSGTLREWAAPPSGLGAEWLDAWSKHSELPFEAAWTRTVEEIYGLIEIARGGMSRGALGGDEDVLQALGCLDRATNGSGTATAVGAVFLASRTAANAAAGLLTAAFATGADTDTLASMTASILAALGGDDWLAALRDSVQDAAYLKLVGERAAQRLADRDAGTRVRRTASDRLVRALEAAEPDAKIAFLDGRGATLVVVDRLPTRSASLRAARYTLRTDDGQTLYITKTGRGQASSGVRRAQPHGEPDVVVHRLGIKMAVSNLARSREFYEELLGLAAPRKVGTTFATYDDVLALTTGPAAQSLGLSNNAPTVFIEVTGIDVLYKRVQASGAEVTERLGARNGDRRRFTCIDPDGYAVEVRELAAP